MWTQLEDDSEESTASSHLYARELLHWLTAKDDPAVIVLPPPMFENRIVQVRLSNIHSIDYTACLYTATAGSTGSAANQLLVLLPKPGWLLSLC